MPRMIKNEKQQKYEIGDKEQQNDNKQ